MWVLGHAWRAGGLRREVLLGWFLGRFHLISVVYAVLAGLAGLGSIQTSLRD